MDLPKQARRNVTREARSAGGSSNATTTLPDAVRDAADGFLTDFDDDEFDGEGDDVESLFDDDDGWAEVPVQNMSRKEDITLATGGGWRDDASSVHGRSDLGGGSDDESILVDGSDDEDPLRGAGQLDFDDEEEEDADFGGGGSEDLDEIEAGRGVAVQSASAAALDLSLGGAIASDADDASDALSATNTSRMSAHKDVLGKREERVALGDEEEEEDHDWGESHSEMGEEEEEDDVAASSAVEVEVAVAAAAAARRPKRKRAKASVGIDANPGGHETRARPPADLIVPLPGMPGAPPLRWDGEGAAGRRRRRRRARGGSTSAGGRSTFALQPYTRGWPTHLHNILVSGVNPAVAGIDLGEGAHLRLTKRARRAAAGLDAAEGDAAESATRSASRKRGRSAADAGEGAASDSDGSASLNAEENDNDFSDFGGDDDDAEGDSIELEIGRFTLDADAAPPLPRRRRGKPGERGVLADAFAKEGGDDADGADGADGAPKGSDAMHDNTKRLARALKDNGFDGGKTIQYNAMADKCDRYDVAVGFWQLLALSTRGYVNLKQASAFGDIEISKRAKFDDLVL